jgi:hypothetical protein
MLVGAATSGYRPHVGGKGDSVENRWWVDQGKDGTTTPIPRPPAKYGHRFFKTGDGFEQERARLRLTDLNLKWFEEAGPPVEGWVVLRMLPDQRVPDGRVERVKKALVVPRGGRGILVDSGNALRAIVTGNPVGERLVEVRLGEESSFDAWVRGEWVREVVFRDFETAIRRVPALVREYLTTDRAASLA